MAVDGTNNGSNPTNAPSGAPKEQKLLELNSELLPFVSPIRPEESANCTLEQIQRMPLPPIDITRFVSEDQSAQRAAEKIAETIGETAGQALKGLSGMFQDVSSLISRMYPDSKAVKQEASPSPAPTPSGRGISSK